jgi:hypothetical protein
MFFNLKSFFKICSLFVFLKKNRNYRVLKSSLNLLTFRDYSMPVTMQKKIHVWRPETKYSVGDYLFILNLDLVKKSLSFDLMSDSEYPGYNPGDKYSLDSKDLKESELQEAMHNIEGVVLRGLKGVEFPDESGVYDDPELNVKDVIPYLEWLIGKTRYAHERANLVWAMNTLKKYEINK